MSLKRALSYLTHAQLGLASLAWMVNAKAWMVNAKGCKGMLGIDGECKGMLSPDRLNILHSNFTTAKHSGLHADINPPVTSYASELIGQLVRLD